MKSDHGMFFDRAGEPIELETVLRLYEDSEYRFLARDRVGAFEVVTAWLGINQNLDVEPPLIFGTAALIDEHTSDGREYLATTEDQARTNHVELVARLRNSNAPQQP